MTEGPIIITCPVCGKKMAVPPQYKNTPGKCPVCGTVVNANPSPAPNIILPDSPIDDLHQAAKPVSAAVPASIQKQNMSFKRALRGSLLYMAAGAAVGGVISSLVMYSVDSSTSFSSYKGFITNSGTGATIGSMVAGTWCLIRKLSLNLTKAVLYATIIGLTTGTFFYLLEWGLVSQPDEPIWQGSIVGALAGFVTGLIFGNILTSEE